MRYFSICAAGLLTLTAALPASTSSSDVSASVLSTPKAITYVQNFHTTAGGNLSLLPIQNEHTRLSHIYLAALHVNPTPGDIHLNDVNPNDTSWDTVWQQAAELQRDGVKVMMMLGGAARGSYKYLCSGDPEGEDDSIVINDDYYLPLYHTLKYHRLDGVDLDIEERVALSCPLALLQRLYADFGRDFILTMAPVATDLQPRELGLGGYWKYSALDAQANATDKPHGKLINWFNAQFYNGWGDASSPVGYNAIINHGYDPSRVVLGVLDSPNDGGSGWHNLSVYTSTVQQLRANYPTFAGVVSWEYYDSGAGDEEGDSYSASGSLVQGNGTYHDDPWTWQRSIADALWGHAETPGGSANFTSSPLPKPASPWPAASQSMQSQGVSWDDSIWALNNTGGDVAAALSLVGKLLSDLEHALDDLL